MGSALGVSVNGTQRDERLARTAFRNHGTCAGLLPTPDQAADRERLGSIRLPKELADQAWRWVIDTMQGWEILQDPVPEFDSVGPEIC
jgi:hypothetical protein